jgi:hypothetical protein
MKARLKRGKVISGRLAEIFVSRKLAEPVKQGRPKKEKVDETKEEEVKKPVQKQTQKAKAK